MRSAAVLGVLLAVAACAETDPYQREGMWKPVGANATNLAAMVANPRDLLRGRGDRGSDGPEAAGGVIRLWAGKTTALPGAASQQTVSGPAAPAPAAPATTPAAN